MEAKGTIVDYSLPVKEIKQRIDEGPFVELSSLDGTSIDDLLYTLGKEISSHPINELIGSPTKSIELITEFLTKSIPMKQFSIIGQNWPITIPNTLPAIQEMYYMLVKLAMESPDPEAVIKWISKGPFPRQYNTPNTTSGNPYVIAVTKCQENDEWAILDCNDHLTIYKVTGTECTIVKSQDADHAKLDGEGRRVTVYNDENKVIHAFTPISSANAKLWPKVFDYVNIPYLAFMDAGAAPYPDAHLIGLYGALQSTNMFIVRSLLSEEVSIAKPLDLLSSLYDIFSHNGHMVLFLEAAVASQLERADISVKKILDPHSIVSYLWQILLKKAGQPYFRKFGGKLIRYIENHGNMGLSNPYELESAKVAPFIFSIFKYIANSASFIDPRLQTFLSIFKSYFEVTNNSKADLIAILKVFVLHRYILMGILKPKTYTTIHTTHSIMQHTGSFLKDRVDGEPLPSCIEDWQPRLEQKVYPSLEKFLFQTCEVTSSATFPAPKQDDLKTALASVITTLGTFQKKAERAMEVCTDPRRPFGSVASWNIAVAVAAAFKRTYEPQDSEDAEEAEFPDLPPAEGDDINIDINIESNAAPAAAFGGDVDIDAAIKEAERMTTEKEATPE